MCVCVCVFSLQERVCIEGCWHKRCVISSILEPQPLFLLLRCQRRLSLSCSQDQRSQGVSGQISIKKSGKIPVIFAVRMCEECNVCRVRSQCIEKLWRLETSAHTRWRGSDSRAMLINNIFFTFYFFFFYIFVLHVYLYGVMAIPLLAFMVALTCAIYPSLCAIKIKFIVRRGGQ